MKYLHNLEIDDFLFFAFRVFSNLESTNGEIGLKFQMKPMMKKPLQ
jgi:hypothetical protein